MDDKSKNEVIPRKPSTTSTKQTGHDGSNRKPPSIYEINDLYSALQDLVHPSPSVEHRRLRSTTSNVDSSDGTSGTDSPDIRGRAFNSKRNSKVIRSSSSITPRFSSPDIFPERDQGRRPKISTPELQYKKLSNQRKPIGIYEPSTSPKVTLKKSKSDAPRTRSRSSIDNSMADKIRKERLRFTDGLKRREKEEAACIVEGVAVKGIDDLLQMARLSPKQETRKKKKSKGPRKRVNSIINANKGIRHNSSDSNLSSLEISTRLNVWYEKASSQALQPHAEDSYESSSGSDSGNRSKEEDGMRKGRSLGNFELESEIFEADGVLEKWMGQKRNRLVMEERGRSSSDTSYEPISADETSPSTSSLAKTDSWQDQMASEDCKGNRQTSIIISQASIDAPNGVSEKNDNTGSELPNQPVFYIANLAEERKTSPRIIRGADKKDQNRKDQKNNNLLLTPTRPRSRSAISSGELSERENESVAMKKDERRSRSLGLHRRGSVDTAQVAEEREMKERLLRTTSEYRRSPRPRSLHLGLEKTHSDTRYIQSKQDHAKNSTKTNFQTEETANAYHNTQKHEKTKKFSKLSNVPGKLKALLSGKKT